MKNAETTMLEAITSVATVSLLALSVALDCLEQNLHMIMNEDSAVKNESKANPKAAELSEVCQVRKDMTAMIRVTARVTLAKVTAIRESRWAKSFGRLFCRGSIASSTNETQVVVEEFLVS